MMKSFAALLILLSVSTQGIGQASDGKDSMLSKKTPVAESDDSGDLPPGFRTDGCTMFPDGNYRDCCVAHDIDYYRGGKGRRASDKRLYRCVKRKKGWQNKFIAPLMYIGVRIGGVSFLPTPFRWGFGKKRMKKLKEKAKAEKDKPDAVNEKDKSNN